MSMERSPTVRRVLVVDDDRSAAQAVAAILESLGHDVRVALNGDAALAAADDCCPAVVFLGTIQPYSDRSVVLKRLRELPGMRQAHMVSFDRRSAARAEAPFVGFDDLLTRPLNFSDVARTMERAGQRDGAVAHA